MKQRGKKFLYWLPRVLCIVFILFLALFALDVFIEDYTILETIVALFMHLLPNFMLLIFLVIAWRNEKLGGVLFILLGAGFTVFFNTYQHLAGFLIVSLPVFVIGILFLISWNVRKRKKNK